MSAPEPLGSTAADELSDITRIKLLYEGRGDGREPFWSPTSWGMLVPEIQFGEGQFRDQVVEALRDHGLATADMQQLRVVELGCGWGRNLNLFADLGVPAAHIAGVDLIAQFVEFGRTQNPAMHLAVGDATNSGLGTAQFDVVLLHTVLSAILDPHIHEALLGEARRLLKPTGVLIVFDIDERYPVGRTPIAGEPVTFIMAVRREALLTMANRAGLALRSARRSGLSPRLRKLVFRSFGTRGFTVRRAIGSLIGQLPSANSHRLMTFVPAVQETQSEDD